MSNVRVFGDAASNQQAVLYAAQQSQDLKYSLIGLGAGAAVGAGAGAGLASNHAKGSAIGGLIGLVLGGGLGWLTSRVIAPLPALT